MSDPYAGARAESVRTELDGIATEQIEQTLNTLVARYNQGRMTYETMIGSIAEIAALRKLRDKARRRVMEQIDKAGEFDATG